MSEPNSKTDQQQQKKHGYSTRSTGPAINLPPPLIPKQVLHPPQPVLPSLIELMAQEQPVQGPSNPPVHSVPVVQPQLSQLSFAAPKDEVLPITRTFPDKKIGEVKVFNNGGFATYKDTTPFKRIKVYDDATDAFNALARAKIAHPFPAFPVDSNMPDQDRYIWFCQAAGMGYILDRQTLSPEKVSADNAMRYGIGTLIAYKISGVNMYSMDVVDSVSYQILKSAYPKSIMTEDLWKTYNHNQRFSYLGTIFNYTFMTRTSMTVTQLLTYSYVKFCLSMIRKEPSIGICNLVKNLTVSKVQFYFTPVEFGVWDDINCVSIEKKQEMLESLFQNQTDMVELFKILYKRIKTHGLTSLFTILDAFNRFPHFPWKFITEEWYHEEVNAFFLAAEAVHQLKFPALHKDVLSAHPVNGYRKLAAFCAKCLEFSGISKKLRNHEGLKKIRLPEDRIHYIKSLVASPVLSKTQGFSQNIFDRLKVISKDLAGYEFDDPTEAAKRQALIEKTGRERDAAEKARMERMLQHFNQQVLASQQPQQ